MAARKFSSKTGESKSSGNKRPGPEPKFREIGDELQTDETFDHDIVDRMGTRFYTKVFAPAIAEAKAQGKSYEDIRDPIRKDWKPINAAAARKK
ncbi:MAG: hypothetical protein ACR2OU_12605 [Thermomicrobiales bacterium]